MAQEQALVYCSWARDRHACIDQIQQKLHHVATELRPAAGPDARIADVETFVSENIVSAE